MENNNWTLWYSVEWIREQCENVTAAVASRRDKDGKMRSGIILTADRDELFRRLLRDAVSDVRTKLAGIVEPEHPSDEIERETTVHLHLKEFAGGGDSYRQPAVVRVIDDRVRQYLTARIVYGWFAMAAPDCAEPFAAEMNEAMSALNSAAKTKAFSGARRRYRLY